MTLGQSSNYIGNICKTITLHVNQPQVRILKANAICKHIHQVLGTMMRTSEIDTANSVEPADIDTFIDNVAWVIG
jgi:hypothetical protein